MSLVLLVALPFLASLLAALLPANARNAESTLAGVIALLCALLTALSFPDIAGGGVLRQEIAWLPTLGMNLILRLDGFAWMFCMLVLGIGALVKQANLAASTGEANRLIDGGGVRIDAGGSQIDATVQTRWRRILDNLGRNVAWDGDGS